jgi:hypothetical protein
VTVISVPLRTYSPSGSLRSIALPSVLEFGRPRAPYGQPHLSAPRRVEVGAKRSYNPARREAGCPSSAPRRPHGRRTPASRRGTPRPTSGAGVVAPRVPRARAPGAAAPGTRASGPTTACSGDARVVHDREGTGERSGRAWPPCLGHGRHRRRARTAVSVARSDEFNRPGPVGPQRSAIGRERRDPHAPASRDARRDAPT